MRVGILDAETIAIFKGLSREVTYDDDIQPTELWVYTTSCVLLALTHRTLLVLPHETK